MARPGDLEAGRPLGILISDEDEGARRALVGSLEPRRWELYEAGSGREALRILRSRLVHVLVSEVELPDTSGFGVVQSLRRFRRQVPFILMASRLNKEVLLRAMLARAFTVMRKPVDQTLFRSTLDHLVGRWYGSGGLPAWDDCEPWQLREDELLL